MRFFIGIFTILIFSGLSSDIQNDYRLELRKLFNGLPIDKGIPEIIDASTLVFTFNEAKIASGTSIKWTSSLPNFSYRKTPATKIRLELKKESQYESLACYGAAIRLYYKDIHTLEQEYNAVKAKFEQLGGNIERNEIRSEQGEIEFRSTTIYATTKYKIPILTFSMTRQLGKGYQYEYQLFIDYQNCLNLPD